MNAFRDHLFNLRDQALEGAMRARDNLTLVLDECEDPKFAAAMEQVAHAQPYARWWMSVTDEIEHGGLEPMAALTKVRTAARQSLLSSHHVLTGSWFTIARWHAAAEATRRFYHDTAKFNLDTVTGTGPATPTITGTSHAAAPHTETSHQTTSPTWRAVINPSTPMRPHTGPDTTATNRR